VFAQDLEIDQAAQEDRGQQRRQRQRDEGQVPQPGSQSLHRLSLVSRTVRF
jgi:hypothetical protein